MALLDLLQEWRTYYHSCWDCCRSQSLGVSSLWGLPLLKRARLTPLPLGTVHTNDWSMWEGKGLASHQLGHHGSFRILCRVGCHFLQDNITIQLLPLTNPISYIFLPWWSFLKVLPNKHFAWEHNMKQPSNRCYLDCWKTHPIIMGNNVTIYLVYL